MKSKPPTKKIKLEVPAPPSPTSSSVSSLLSIPPTKSSTSAEIIAAAKAVTSGVKAARAAPTYPTYVHTDVKEWPRMNMLLNYPKGSGDKPPVLGPEGIMTMDDLDALQSELETLWSAMACRIRSLKVDQALTQNSAVGGGGGGSVNCSVLGEHYDQHHQEKINAVASLIDAGHGTRTSVSAAAKLVMGSQGAGASSSSNSPIPTGGKKGTAIASKLDKLPKKKLKGESGSLTKKGAEKPARSTQNRSHSVSSDFGGFDGFYKHEAPNEFWDFADNYCKQIGSGELEELRKIIEEHKTSIASESLVEIPPLGKYFKEGERTKPDPKTLKRIDACGPLTQRLVTALVDERISMYNAQRLGSPREEGGTQHQHEHQHFIHRTGLIKALGLDGGPNRPPMESQLRECLLDRGLINPEDANDPLLFNSEDEILAEIRRTQNTLRKLHEYNGDKLEELYVKAEKEMERSTLKLDLDKADKDVIEAYKTIVSLKQKKKLISKKDKETAVKALESRDKALLKLTPSIKSEGVAVTTALKVEV